MKIFGRFALLFMINLGSAWASHATDAVALALSSEKKVVFV